LPDSLVSTRPKNYARSFRLFRESHQR
jgi:hypothetical protein